MLTLKKRYLFIFLLVFSTIVPTEIYALNFTRGTETAQKFGVHEIALTGDGSVANPFDTPCEVIFISPSGISVTVNAFYDGSNIWRARCYVNEIGNWTWKSVSTRDFGLDNKSGSFSALESNLRGKLKKHPGNNKALATDDGKWFLNIADTPYLIFSDKYDKWQEFIRDSWNLGITLFRASMLGALRDWDSLFENGNRNKLNISNFQTNDTRLKWMLDNYPDLYVEFILFGECNTGWGGDETLWNSMSTEQHNRILKYIVARYAAFPEIIWEIVNDYKYSESHPHNIEMADEIGYYLMNNDPWNHLITSGGIRGDEFYFKQVEWATLFHLETLDALSADHAEDYSSYPVHVFDAEDRYETYKQPDNPKIYFRRLIWSWTLSGGSAGYGGDWDDIVPYSQTSFEGLDNIIHIRNFFQDKNIELSDYIPDDNCVSSPARGVIRPKVMRDSTKSSYIIYHPNASVSGKAADVSTRTATLTIDNLPTNKYSILWMRADNGKIQQLNFNHEGGDKLLTSPWSGIDVVLYLQPEYAVGVGESRSIPAINDNDVLNVQFNSSTASTKIKVSLPENTKMSLDIINVQGGFVERLVAGSFNSCMSQFLWNTENHTSGIYFVNLITENKVYNRKISVERNW